jgi:hypothetical protein
MRSSNAHTTMHRHCRGLWEVGAFSAFTSVHLAVWNCNWEVATSNVQLQRQQAAWVRGLRVIQHIRRVDYRKL